MYRCKFCIIKRVSTGAPRHHSSSSTTPPNIFYNTVLVYSLCKTLCIIIPVQCTLYCVCSLFGVAVAVLLAVALTGVRTRTVHESRQFNDSARLMSAAHCTQRSTSRSQSRDPTRIGFPRANSGPTYTCTQSPPSGGIEPRIIPSMLSCTTARFAHLGRLPNCTATLLARNL
jgi:hypothetical protein